LSTNWNGRARLNDIKDGTANTLLFAERYSTCSKNGSVNCSADDAATPWDRWDAQDRCGATFAAWDTTNVFQVQPEPQYGGGNCDPQRASSPHSGGMNAALADGSVRWLAAAVSQTTWQGLLTPTGREVLGADW
jgi:prepilin-type processing-associated H-X9-DG protein